MFVPPGYIPLLNAVRQLVASAIEAGDAEARVIGRGAKRLPIPFAVRKHLRQALGEGKLVAIGVGQEDGSQVAVPQEYWRSKRGAAPLLTGVMGLPKPSHSVTRYQQCDLYLPEAGLQAWRNPSPAEDTTDGRASQRTQQVTTKPDKALVLAVATGFARDLLDRDGQPPKQTQVIARMREEGFQPQESKEAAKNLPDDLKRGRGEHDKKVASDKRPKSKRTVAKRPKA